MKILFAALMSTQLFASSLFYVGTAGDVSVIADETGKKFFVKINSLYPNGDKLIAADKHILITENDIFVLQPFRSTSNIEESSESVDQLMEEAPSEDLVKLVEEVTSEYDEIGSRFIKDTCYIVDKKLVFFYRQLASTYSDRVEYEYQFKDVSNPAATVNWITTESPSIDDIVPAECPAPKESEYDDIGSIFEKERCYMIDGYTAKYIASKPLDNDIGRQYEFDIFNNPRKTSYYVASNDTTIDSIKLCSWEENN